MKKVIVILSAGIKKEDGKWVSTGYFTNEDFDLAPGGTLRIKATYELYIKNPEALIFIPGGRGRGVKNDEINRPDLCDLIALELETLGVPKEKIIKERRSNDTVEQLFAIKYFIEKYHYTDVFVVTNEYQASRVKGFIEHFTELQKLSDLVYIESAENVLLASDYEKWIIEIEKFKSNPNMKVWQEREKKGLEDLSKGQYKKNMLSFNDSQGVRFIGNGHPVFIVAEISGNHNQDINNAFRIMDAAAASGSDAVKLQTYTPDTITIDSNKDYFKIKGGPWDGKNLYELYGEAYTPWDWHPKLKEYAEKLGLVFFSSPFDNTSVDFLEELNVPIYKIASFEVVDIPLLKKVGSTKKPVIMSSGMASSEEIKLALETLKKAGTPHVAVLHCISSYPTKPEDMNLSTIPDLQKRYNVVTGLSDHSLSSMASEMAVSLGAKIIEKHLTLRRSDGGPDAGFSLEPEEFKNLVSSIRQAEKALGSVLDGPGTAEVGSVIFRKSLFAVQDIKKGEKLTKENVRSIRPGHGLPPKFYDEILNKKAKTDIEKGTPLSWDLTD